MKKPYLVMMLTVILIAGLIGIWLSMITICDLIKKSMLTECLCLIVFSILGIYPIMVIVQIIKSLNIKKEEI